MAFTLYTSADAGAPVLTGAAGTLLALLHACLVTGYGAKAAAGWSRPWLDASGNLAVFKPNDAQDFFLHINDAGPGAGTYKEARAHCGMTHDGAGNLGTRAPQNAGYPNGLFVRKSNTTDATARDWFLYADGKTAYLMIDPGDSAGRFLPFFAGKALAVSPIEAYPWIIAGTLSENYTSISSSSHNAAYFLAEPGTYPNAFTPVQADGSGTGTGLRYAPAVGITGSTSPHLLGTLGPGAPGPRTGIAPLFDGLMTHDKEPRLRTRGLWSAYAAGGIGEGDTFSATIGGVLRSFVCRRVAFSGIYLFETSDTLDL